MQPWTYQNSEKTGRDKSLRLQRRGRVDAVPGVAFGAIPRCLCDKQLIISTGDNSTRSFLGLSRPQKKPRLVTLYSEVKEILTSVD
ncbi:hypothetical protein CHELA40_12122 [Chelatococcus asaccharovorans]|nr:hypothetical protein CHELA40_12122 [Chelatococcus asaccharovorans]CAH1683403.1 hypothetical protein CHELA17_63482 [Chelatococcus asaccharovorans]